MSKNKTVRAAEMCQWLVRVASMMSIPYSACSSRQLVIVNGFNGFVSCVLTQNKLYSKFFFFSFFCCCYKQLGFCFSLIRTWSWCVQTAPFSSSPFPGTPSVIVRGHRGPFISPWEWGWGRGWCRGMRAKAGALCQVTKAFQNNNSYHSLPEPVGLYGSPWDCAGMCRCQWKDVEGFWKGCWWWGSVSRHVSRNGRALLPALIFYTPNVQSKNKIPMILVIQRGQTSPIIITIESVPNVLDCVLGF